MAHGALEHLFELVEGGALPILHNGSCVVAPPVDRQVVGHSRRQLRGGPPARPHAPAQAVEGRRSRKGGAGTDGAIPIPVRVIASPATAELEVPQESLWNDIPVWLGCAVLVELPRPVKPVEPPRLRDVAGLLADGNLDRLLTPLSYGGAFLRGALSRCGGLRVDLDDFGELEGGPRLVPQSPKALLGEHAHDVDLLRSLLTPRPFGADEILRRSVGGRSRRGQA